MRFVKDQLLLGYAIVFVLCMADRCFCFQNGFPRSSCDSMLPEESMATNGESLPTPSALFPTTTSAEALTPKPTDEGRATTAMAAAALEAGDSASVTVLSISNRPSPFSLIASETTVRRNEEVKVTVTGSDTVEAFLIEAITLIDDDDVEIMKREGTFTEWDKETTQQLDCGDGEAVTALTNKDIQPKSNLTFTWKAHLSDDSHTNVIFRATFVVGKEYWTNIQTSPVEIKEFPISLSSCAVSKSCFRISTKSSDQCTTDSCDYIISYKPSADNRTLDVVMGGNGKRNNYIAFGFTKDDNESRKDTRIIACIMDDVIEIKYFSLPSLGEEPNEENAILENPRSDVYNDRMWCGFSYPLKPPSDSLGDLTVPVYHVYFWGEVNETNSIPIIPAKKEIVISEQPVDLSAKFVDVVKFKSNDASALAGVRCLLLVVCSALASISLQL